MTIHGKEKEPADYAPPYGQVGQLKFTTFFYCILYSALNLQLKFEER